MCAIILFALGATSVPAHAEDFAAHFVIDSPAIALPPLAFEDASGRNVSLKDFQGRYVLLNLWATWCSPCREELPSLDALQAQLGGSHFTVLTLAEDSNGLAATKGFFDRHKIQHLSAYVDTSGEAPSLLHARGLPTTYLIDPHGNEIGHVVGDANWSAPDSVAFLKQKISR